MFFFSLQPHRSPPLPIYKPLKYLVYLECERMCWARPQMIQAPDRHLREMKERCPVCSEIEPAGYHSTNAAFKLSGCSHTCVSAHNMHDHDHTYLLHHTLVCCSHHRLPRLINQLSKQTFKRPPTSAAALNLSFTFLCSPRHELAS